MSTDVPGGSLSNALDITINSNVQVFTDTISSSQSSNCYTFGLQGRSSFYLSLNDFDSGGNLNVELVRDDNNDGLAQPSAVIAFSSVQDQGSKFISADLDSGNYYVQVYAGDNYTEDNTQTFYDLSVSATPDEADATPYSFDTPIATAVGSTSLSKPIATAASPTPVSSPSNPSWKIGTLGADIFTYDPSQSTPIIYISGNGDIDFGAGKRDTLDLKTAGIALSQVSVNWANTLGGGVKANPGNGARIFDTITLNSNYYQIFFEGIEQIQFSDVTIDLSNLTILANGTKATVTTNDEKFNQQWDLHATGVQNAWRFTQGTANVLIGIEDSGLGVNASGQIHPDLRSTIYSGTNYIDESDTSSHGTAVQSVIAATANNGIGIAGINWFSDVEQVDVIGGNADDKDLATATQILIDQANSKGQKLVVNLSLSGGTSQAFINLVAQNSNNVLFVAAAGNDNLSSISSPGNLAADYNNFISVGSSWGNTDWYGIAKKPGQRADYSSNNPELIVANQPQVGYTAWWGSNYVDQATVNAGRRPLTLMAPTEYVAANADSNKNGTFSFNYNDKFNGTSASTPIVTGIASLVWSANPNLTAAQVKTILAQTAVDLGATGYDQYYGYGFVNADAAVRAALAMARV